ncbi:AAA family ATPase [Clostridium perfringens]|nr:AAA family ATPase [Clostridium perfringens]
MYFINRLKISNFKLIEDKKIIDFSNSDLVVLDGPNGYGKTSIFDAIEILVKGHRNLDEVFNSEYKDGDKPVLYAYNKDKPIVLRGEFINEFGEKLIIERKIDDPSNTGKISDLKNRFNLFKLNNFEESYGEKITQKYLNNILGLYPDENIYNLMYYIQQEETLFFLKQNEYKRKEILNTLFNMEKECREQNKIIKLRDKLNSRRREIGGNNGQGGKIAKINNEINAIKIKQAIDIEYKRLIEYKEIIWDKKSLELDYDVFQQLILELNKIKLLRENLNDYEAILYNKKIDFALNLKQRDIIRCSLINKNDLEDYDSIVNKFKLIDYYKSFIIVLKNSDYIAIHQFLQENSDLKSNLSNKFNVDKFCESILDIEAKSKNINELDSLIININSIRKNLEREYEKYNLRKKDDDICPFCGYNYGQSNFKLTNKILDKEKYFTNQLNNNNKELDDLIKKNKENFIIPMIEFLEKEINKNDIKKEYKELLDLAILNKKRINDFNIFCNGIGINLEKFKLDRENYSLIKEREYLKLLLETLNLKKRKLENEEFIMNKDDIDRIFINIFDSNIEKVKKLTINDIANKKLYLENMFNNQENIKRNKKIKEKELLKKKYDILNYEYIKCKDIASIYKKCIDKYSNNIIKVLQIPIYIYTGKIIQDYQGGLGVFIKSENGNQQLRLKFVNNNNSKHDLLNKFSSGQLSGLILSIMLSLNKVFSNGKFTSLLIDDPLQSMDDINMTSFVELLRNEFGKCQIILSTHDDRISRYIRYKFEKFNLKTIRYNVKEEFSKNEL